MAQCSRSGCTKQLRKDNTKGACSSNCESAEAPNGVRAKEVAESAAVPKPDLADKHNASEVMARFRAEVMARFRAVTKALGLDAEVILAEAARDWLDGVRDLLDGTSTDEE